MSPLLWRMKLELNNRVTFSKWGTWVSGVRINQRFSWWLGWRIGFPRDYCLVILLEFQTMIFSCAKYEPQIVVQMKQQASGYLSFWSAIFLGVQSNAHTPCQLVYPALITAIFFSWILQSVVGETKQVGVQEKKHFQSYPRTVVT